MNYEKLQVYKDIKPTLMALTYFDGFKSKSEPDFAALNQNPKCH